MLTKMLNVYAVASLFFLVAAFAFALPPSSRVVNEVPNVSPGYECQDLNGSFPIRTGIVLLNI